MNRNRFFGALMVVALLGAAGPAQADFMSKGRTRAIRVGIAAHINKNPVAHVNYGINQARVTRQVKPSEIRFRSKRQPSMMGLIGASERAVSWRLKSGILAGTARASTPVVGNGGKLTRVDDVKYTVRPRGMPMQAQQNSRFGRKPTLQDARGHAPGTVGHYNAVRAAGFHPDSIGLEVQAGHRRGTRGFNQYWSNSGNGNRR